MGDECKQQGIQQDWNDEADGPWQIIKLIVLIILRIVPSLKNEKLLIFQKWKNRILWHEDCELPVWENPMKSHYRMILTFNLACFLTAATTPLWAQYKDTSVWRNVRELTIREQNIPAPKGTLPINPMIESPSITPQYSGHLQAVGKVDLERCRSQDGLEDARKGNCGQKATDDALRLYQVMANDRYFCRNALTRGDFGMNHIDSEFDAGNPPLVIVDRSVPVKCFQDPAAIPGTIQVPADTNPRDACRTYSESETCNFIFCRDGGGCYIGRVAE